MIDEAKLNLIAQLLTGMEEIIKRVEKAHERRNTEELELAKREITEFQRKLLAELEKNA